MFDTKRITLINIGLFILRVSFGCMMAFGHGLGKLTTFGEKAESFPDPLGVGSPISAGLAVFAEFFCSLLVVIGLATRVATLPLIVTMAVAALIIHGDDPWQKKELAVVYLVVWITLLCTGPGKYSVDGLLLKRRKTGA